MSLNGDVVVMRNGRSTSTVSIYNYPEHLNPFYEDDQHKRLRFWHINKKDQAGRRSSFSLDGIKDMWAFKSFRTKKKSSTLGINKTSESPPPLRRDYEVDSSHLFNSYDRRARYSSNGTSADGGNFQRNVPYRTSLQNMNSMQDGPGGFGLNRNDQYRSTIQFGKRTQTTTQALPVPQPRRYVYGGSVTPQPSRSTEYGRGTNRDSLTHGSSQTSVSTNPFDSDNDEDIEANGSVCGAISLTEKRTARKKRRAPAPPVPIHNANSAESFSSNRLTLESSQAHPAHQTELRIEENRDIANLTAEIESFVKTTNDDTAEIPKIVVEHKPLEEPQLNKEIPKRNGSIPRQKVVTKTSNNMVITREFKPQQRETELFIREESKPALPEKKKKTQQQQQPQQNSQELGHVECIHVHVESPRSTPERNIPSRVTSFKKDHQNKSNDDITGKTSFTLASPPTNRREVPTITIEKKQIVVTETVAVPVEKEEVKPSSPSKENGLVNGHESAAEPPTVVKPPIASKPTIEAKANNFAVIHKPSRRHMLNNEKDEITVDCPKPAVVEEVATIKETKSRTKIAPPIPTVRVTTTETTVINEVTPPPPQASNSISSVSTTEIVSKTNETPKIESKPQKHVVFETSEPQVRTIVTTAEVEPTVKIEKVVVVLEKEKPKSTKRVEEEKELTVSIKATTKDEPKIETTETTEAPTSITAAPALTVVETSAIQRSIEEPTTSSATQSRPSTSSRAALQTNPREEFEAMYRPKPATHLEWKQSTLAPLETHVPPEKRRSVKDIIESINRSQRLLHAAANKDLPQLSTTSHMPPPAYSEVVDETTYRAQQPQPITATNNDLSQDIRSLEEAQEEIDRMFEEIAEAAGTSHSGSSNTNANNVDAQKPNNEEIFKKCRVNKEVYDYRESSPTTSNLDWNPVPKPKRSKNLAEHPEQQ